MVGMAVAATAGGFLVNAILPVSSSVDSVDASYASADYSKSNTYSWDPSPNGDQEGGMLGVLYGTHRVTPHIIGRYVSTSGNSQYLNILYAVCEGGQDRIDAISDVEVNDNPVTYYSSVELRNSFGNKRPGGDSLFQRTPFSIHPSAPGFQRPM
jgi:hypothetical protein